MTDSGARPDPVRRNQPNVRCCPTPYGLPLELTPMNTANAQPKERSREELYELVWSKPMTAVAAELGVSDVALAKRCRKLFVPTLKVV